MPCSPTPPDTAVAAVGRPQSEMRALTPSQEWATLPALMSLGRRTSAPAKEGGAAVINQLVLRVAAITGVAALGPLAMAGSSVHAAAATGEASAAAQTAVAGTQVQSDVSFRKAFGLRSDPVYIESLYTRDQDGTLRDASREFGALLTSAEAARFAFGQAVERAALPPIFTTRGSSVATPFSTYLRDHAANFGGEAIDHAHGDVVTLTFTDQLAAHRAALLSLFPYPDHLRFLQGTYTASELRDFSARVVGDLAALNGAGAHVVSVGPDYATNSVRVAVSSPAGEAAVRHTFGSLPLEFAITAASHPVGDRNQDAPPMMGGMGIWSCNNDACLSATECTAGFIVTDGSSFYMSTAGHCTLQNLAFEQGPTFASNYIVGVAGASRFDNGDDAAVVKLFVQSDKTNNVYLSQQSCGFLCTQRNIRIIKGQENFPTQGESACMSGATSGGEHCGTVTAIDQCVFYAEFNITLCSQEFVNWAASPGDSGSPWYMPQTSGTSIAQGIESGSNLSNQSNYTQIVTALSGLGNYLVYSG